MKLGLKNFGQVPASDDSQGLSRIKSAELTSEMSFELNSAGKWTRLPLLESLVDRARLEVRLTVFGRVKSRWLKSTLSLSERGSKSLFAVDRLRARQKPLKDARKLFV